MSGPLAYLLTWTCYGTWMHGDVSGSVDDERNQFGEPFLPADMTRRCVESAHLKALPIILDDRSRANVRRTIEAHGLIRGWHLHAVNVRTNHVHVVVGCGEVRPEEAMNQFKAWCTRRLREEDCVVGQEHIWTKHGSTRYLWKEPSVARAVEYVLEHQV